MRGSYIGIMVDESPELTVGILAILKSGNCFVPINPTFPNDRINFIIDDCKINVLLTDKANYDRGSQIAGGNPLITRHICTDVDNGEVKIEVKIEAAGESNPRLHETCYVIYTSGSTGRPKGVPITHGSLVPLLLWFLEYFELGPHTRVFQNLSYSFDFGVFELLSTLLAGGILFFFNPGGKGDLTASTDYINKKMIDTIHTTPAFFNGILSTAEKMPGLKLVHLGGERLTSKTVQEVSKRVSPGCRIYNGYGPTEAAINCAVFCTKAGETGALRGMENIPIGKPSALHSIYILSPYNRLQPIGAAGELCVAGPGLSRGYLNRPELTVEFFNRSYKTYKSYRTYCPIYRTGDLARWLPDGNIEFLGRIDRQVKVRGFRIELGEIENCLLLQTGIAQTVVLAKEKPGGDKYLCAYIVPHGSREFTAKELRDYLAQKLPGYMIPAHFIQLDHLPVTVNGKIDINALPGPDDGTIETGTAYEAPVTDTEKKLVTIWQPFLRIERIGVMDDFFQLGGDSILANRCIAAVREGLRVEIPLRKFFETPRIRALAGEIDRMKGDRNRKVMSIPRASRREKVPLSFAQERLWFLQELDARNVAYFVPRVIRMEGELKVDLLERTFTEIIRRHEILRTTFPTEEGRPVQSVHPPYRFKIPITDWSGENEREQDRKAVLFLKEEGRRPFDFKNGPLLRVTLLKLAADKHLFVLTEHHLIHDGWTQGVLLREFITIFTAYSGNEEHRLPELPIQYADYALWQRDYLKGEVLEEHLAYWKEKLAGLPPVLDLPADRPRPPVISGKGALKISTLPCSVTHRLEEFCRQNGVTLFMAMLAVFKSLLYRYTGVEDLCVGTGVANRRFKEMEGMLGMVINTLPLRTQIPGDVPFNRFQYRVKETCSEAYRHEDTPFGKIVEVLQPERNLSYTPIFQVLFSFMDTPAEALRLPGLELELLPLHNRSSKFDINVVVVPPLDDRGGPGEEILVEWEYNTDIFDAPTVDRIVAHYDRLLEEAVQSPGKRLSHLAMLSVEETRELLYTFNDTAAPYPGHKTIHRLFQEQARRKPDAAALHMSHGTHTSHMTYSRLNRDAHRQASLLKEKGVLPGTVVAILGERSIEMAVGILAILTAGAVYLPIDADYPEERIDYMLKDSNAVLLLNTCESSGVPAGEPGRIGQIPVRPAPTGPGDIAYIMYTSGSTGQPRGVMVTHRNVVRLVKNSNYVSLSEETRILQTGAPVFDAATFETWGGLLNGGQLVFVNREVIVDAFQLERALKNYRINTLWLSAPLFNRLMRQDIELFGALDYLVVGGDILSPPHINPVRRRFPGLQIINGYGPTENTTFSTTYLIDREFESSIPIGFPIANSTAYIYDRDHRLVPVGVWGELCVGGDGVARGYLNNPELTNSKFQIPNHKSLTPFYRTGDMARWLPDGSLEFKGRLDRQVKIRGFRVELGEIENRLLKHEGVKEVVVIDRSDRGEKYLCAYIVSLPGSALEPGDLRKRLSAGLPGYMIPSFFILLEKIPLNPNGKVDRELLPVPGTADGGTAREYMAPRDSVERKLADIWAEILNIRRPIGIDDNFFDLGGHSLNATLLAARMHKAFNVKIPLLEFFKRGCIREVAEYIKSAVEETFAAVDPVEKKEYYPLSPAQGRLYLLYQIDGNGTAYNIPAMLDLEGVVDKERMEGVFRQLIERHESLRTSFTVINETPVQKVHRTVDFTLRDFPYLPSFIRPFDLSRAPLMRVGLIKESNLKHILMIDMHHIVTDGTSIGLFVKEFMSLYAGEILPPLTLQYKDYSEWQHGRMWRGALEDQASYWLEQFGGDIPILELPTDFTRPAVQSFDGARTGFELAEEETRFLKEFASAEGLTLYTVLLAIFYVFLSKIGHNENIVVGTAAAGRRHSDLERIVGMFVNTLALKNHPNHRVTFKAFLKEVDKNTLKAFENQDYPLDELVENVPVKRNSGRNPLFDVMFVVQNVDIPEVEIPGLKLKPVPVETGTSKFDLMLQALETGKKLLLTYEYCTALFKAETIERFKGFFRRIVSVVIDRPSVKLSEIEIISPEEKHRILEEFNNTTRDYPRDRTIRELYEEQVLRTPDAIALHMSYKTCMTYIELDERSGGLASLLQTKGVGPDTIAGLMLERSVEMVIGILGILKAGGAYLPIDPDYPEERKQYMLTDSSAVLLLTARDIKGCREQACLFHDPADPADRPGSTESGTLAYIMYTSGSTGGPKGVMVTHRNVVRLVKNTEFVPLSEETRILQTGAPVFDAATFEIWGSLLNGGQLVLTGRETILDANRLGRALKDHKINTLWLSSPLFNQLVVQDTGIFAPLSYLLVGGDVLSPSHINRVRERFPGLQVINGYGPTENTTFSTTYLIDGSFKQSIPIGRPVTNSTAYILDGGGGPVPVGVSGELYVGGDGVARGYLNNPELTAERFCCKAARNNRPYKSYRTYCPIYRTGDLAHWLPSGDIEFLGRIDQQVKIRGFRIEPGEIETCLLSHGDIKESVVLARRDDAGDKYLCAYVVTRDESSVPDLGDFLSGKLPDYMVPSYFVPLEKIPLTPNGKVDWRSLPEPGPGIRGIGYTAPRDDVDKKLAAIWAEVLGIEQDGIGIDSDFFELGGHSLKATAIVAKIHEAFDVKMPVGQVFSRPTIREMAAFVKNTKKNEYQGIEPGEKQEYYIQSFAQKRLFFLAHLDDIGPGYNIPSVFNVKGNMDKGRFEAAFKALIARHESLRTSFHMMNDQPVQRVHDKVEFEIEYFDTGDPLTVISQFIRPFDLNEAPLLRAAFAEVPGGERLLLYDMHHIICDGTSSNLLLDDFIRLYAGEGLPGLKVQYRDFSLWQMRLFETGDIKTQEKFWRDIFPDAGDIPVLNFPTDYPRPPVFNFEGDRHGFALGAETASRLKALGLKTGATPFMGLLAAFYVLLYKYTGQDDIVVGGVIAGRRHANVQNIIGMFVNILALRSRPRGDKRYIELLEEVRAASLDAFENQDVQFEMLVDDLEVERDTSRNPMFDVCFGLQNFEHSRTDIGKIEGVEFSPYEFKNKISLFDMSLDAVEAGDDIRFGLEYCTRLFKKDTILRIARRFINIVETVAAEPGTRLADIDLLTEEEKTELLFEFNDTETDFPRDRTIHELFGEQAARTPDKIALVDPRRRGSHMTYSVLNRDSHRLARRLRTMGVVPNRTVGIMAGISMEAVVGILAIIRAGGAYLPIDINLPPGRMKWMLHDSRTSVILTRKSLLETGKGEFLEALEASGQEIVFPDEGKNDTGEGGPVENVNTPGDMIYVMYTSGSTGTPKGVVVEHRSVVNLIAWFAKTYRIGVETRVLQLTDYTFDPSVEDMFGTLLNGGTLFTAGRESMLDRERFRRLVKENRVHVVNSVPHVLKELLVDEQALESLRVVISGGDALEEQVKDEILARGYPLYNNYGPTEITVDALSAKCSEGKVTLGRPVSNVKCYIMDEEQHLLPVGVPGELCISGEGLSRGYLNRPELTAERFCRGAAPSNRSHRTYKSYKTYSLYRTGDLARWLPDGTVEFSGRIDQQVKIRGFRIEPGEIEKHLLRHHGIKEAVVTAGKDGKEDKYLCAYIVPGNEDKLEVSSLRDFLSRDLPGYMIPSYFVQVEKIPLTSNGKIDHRALPEPGTSRSMLAGTYVAPGEELEIRVASIWDELLQVGKVGIYDDFFELGGNSLKVIRLKTRLTEELDRDIPVVALFQHPTVHSFVEYLKTPEEKEVMVSEAFDRSEKFDRAKRTHKDIREKRKMRS